MKHEHKDINFSDERGTITDIFVDRPFSHSVLIHSRKGAVRGNHYHQQSYQCDLVIQGRMAIFGRKKDSDIIEERIAGPNDWSEWGFGDVHEFIALDDEVIFISFVNGTRAGTDYENDTFRIPTPLHVLKGRSLEDILKQ
jgi:hypothetical protein